MKRYGARMARLGLVVGLALALLLGCTQSRVPTDMMANDPLSRNHIRGMEEVDQKRDGAHTALGRRYPSTFTRFLRPTHARGIDHGMIDRAAAAARRAGWALHPTSVGGYRGHKTIEDLDVVLSITATRDDRQVGIFMVAVNEEGRD